jgi:hypothetical protein
VTKLTNTAVIACVSPLKDSITSQVDILSDKHFTLIQCLYSSRQIRYYTKTPSVIKWSEDMNGTK